MKKNNLYTEATLKEFFETCEKNTLDEIFYEISTESMRRNTMITKSLIEYLKLYNMRHTKYDVLKDNAVA